MKKVLFIILCVIISLNAYSTDRGYDPTITVGSGEGSIDFTQLGKTFIIWIIIYIIYKLISTKENNDFNKTDELIKTNIYVQSSVRVEDKVISDTKIVEENNFKNINIDKDLVKKDENEKWDKWLTSYKQELVKLKPELAHQDEFGDSYIDNIHIEPLKMAYKRNYKPSVLAKNIVNNT